MNSTSGLSEFLARATKKPVLTPAKEKQLGSAVRAGDDAEPGSREQRFAHEARNLLVEHNVRLAVKMANGWKGNGIPTEDLVQEALVGLHYAANKFDPARGYKFSTYATQWISRQLWNCVNAGGPIKHSDDILLRIVKVRRKLRERPDASAEELAAYAECTPDEAATAVTFSKAPASLNADTLDGSAPLADRLASQPQHLEGDSRPLEDHMDDPRWCAGDNHDEPDDVSEGLRRALETVRGDAVEVRAVMLKFGLAGGPWSTDEIIQRLTREFVLDPDGDPIPATDVLDSTGVWPCTALSEEYASAAVTRATKKFRNAMRRERESGDLIIDPESVSCVRKAPSRPSPKGTMESSCLQS